MALSPLQLAQMFKTKSLASEGGFVPLASTGSRIKKFLLYGCMIGGAIAVVVFVVRLIPAVLTRRLGSPASAAVAPPPPLASRAPSTLPAVFNVPRQASDVSVLWVLGERAGVRLNGREFLAQPGDDMGSGVRVLSVGMSGVAIFDGGSLRTIPVERLVRGTGNGGAGYGASPGGSGIPPRQSSGGWLSRGVSGR